MSPVAGPTVAPGLQVGLQGHRSSAALSQEARSKTQLRLAGGRTLEESESGPKGQLRFGCPTHRRFVRRSGPAQLVVAAPAAPSHQPGLGAAHP